MVPLLLIEQAFLAANVLKIPEGGWLPLSWSGMICLLVLTWVRGSAQLWRRPRARAKPSSNGWCASSMPSRRTACRARPCS